MAKALTDEQRKLRFDLVEFLAVSIKERADASFYTDEQVAELTKQVKRVAKFLCVVN
jgi:hypothetical protein